MKKSLVSKIFANFFYKVIALVLACLFWYIVQGEEILEVNRRIVVEVHPPRGFVVKGGSEIIRHATLRGPRVWIGALGEEDLKADIHISQKAARAHQFRLTRQHIRDLDSKVSLMVHDPTIRVDVDRVASKAVPVREFFKGTPAKDFFVKKITIQPAQVVVVGPQSEVAKVDQIHTEPIDTGELQQSKTFPAVRLAPVSPTLEIKADTVSVTLQVDERMVNKRFSVVRVQTEGGEYQATVNPPHVSVVLQGPPAVLDEVDERKDLRPFVEIHDLGPGKYEREIRVKIPPNTVLVETVPETAVVDISDKKRLN